MLKCRKNIIILALLSILASGIFCYAEEIEDLVDLFESKNRIIAITERGKDVSFELRSKEEVLWSGAKGYLGAFLSNNRFAVISSSLSTWQVLPLKSAEKGQALLSPNIALLVTAVRAVAFDAVTNQFIKVQLPIHDELIAAETEENIAVVATSSNLFGFVSKTQAFKKLRLHVRESIESIKITYNKATVRTSDRLLTFYGAGSSWKEHRF